MGKVSGKSVNTDILREGLGKSCILAVDESNSQIKAVALSDNSFKDNELFKDLLKGIEDRISQVSADGAYDSKDCYKICKDKGIKFVVPPRKNAVIERAWKLS